MAEIEMLKTMSDNSIHAATGISQITLKKKREELGIPVWKPTKKEVQPKPVPVEDQPGFSDKVQSILSEGLSTTDCIKSLLEIGMRPSNVARTLEVSRQRVHQAGTGYKSPASGKRKPKHKEATK